MLQSHAAFLLAECQHGEPLHDCDAAVIVWHAGEFSTIAELAEERVSHIYHGTIYEAWASEVRREIRLLARELWFTAARALETYANRAGYNDPEADDLWEALEEAKHALEGDPRDVAVNNSYTGEESWDEKYT